MSLRTRQANESVKKESREDEDTNRLNDLVYVSEDEDSEVNQSFFWRPHTVSALIFLLLMLFYVTFIEEETPRTTEYNTKRGILASCGVFIVFGVTQARDGPIVRPHPVLWRFILVLSVIYELGLITLLFQTRDDARRWMSYIDPTLGHDLPEQDYGGNCLIYDSSSTDPWHNLKDKCDIFVVAHFLGWWAKTLMLRDYWLTMVLSALFEILEYSLQHQLPNFSECWWDHWIMDFLVCNGGGILAGMLTLRFLEVKTYNWRDVWSIPTYSGRFRRFFEQFTPYSWRKFDWKATRDVKHWLAVLGLIIVFALAELNVFYLKAALSVPPNNRICYFRIFLFFFCGVVATRETYDFLSKESCKRFGQQAWVMCTMIFTEIFICVKFMRETVFLVPPPHILIPWGFFAVGLVLYTGWLYFCPPPYDDEGCKDTKRE